MGFNDLNRRGLMTEALDKLDRIYKGAALCYETPQYAADGTVVPCQFPANAPIAPVEATYCASGGADRDGDERCDGDPDDGAHETWKALSFKLDKPHHFVYSFTSSGVLVEATFTASAHADLDCDGVYSTFQRMAFGDPKAPPGVCRVRGSAAFFHEQETE